MNAEQIRTQLKRYNLKPNFTYGQNFLIDEIVLQDMADAAEVGKDDMVLEIGPGIGNLTRLLCQQAGFVLSVEKDPKFFPILRGIKKDFKNNFRFEVADALEFDFISEFNKRLQYTDARTNDANNSRHSRDISVLAPPSYKVVANIPYYITGKIIQMLMTAKHKPSSITILTQKEVAQNVVAKAGDLSILAISVQLYGEPKIIRTVPAKSFFPAPKVDSAVLQIKTFSKPKYELGDEKKFFRVVKSCFAGKRKQIHNTLKNNLHLSEEQVTKILSDLKINPAARPQELSIEDWIGLSNKIG